MKAYVEIAPLIEKYNKPGPRYTSYPTANLFSEEFEKENLLKLAAPQATGRPGSLYFHLPFCESLCWFCGCTTKITTDRNNADTYLSYLEKELELSDKHIGFPQEFTQLHFGGGTPNFFTPDQLNQLQSLIEKYAHFTKDAEKSVELDPRRLTREHIQAFAAMGITRASFGVQDCNSKVQEAIHRIQPHEENIQAAQYLREEGFQSLNIDLIYGLPHQTPETFKETVHKALELNPERFAIFSYAHVPWIKPAQKILEKKDLPSPEVKIQLLLTVIETLEEAGYVYIGMDHFAKKDDELLVAQKNQSLQRNFQGYSTKAEADIYAFGMSSISQNPYMFRQNLKDLDSYYQALDKKELPIHKAYLLKEDDEIRRKTIMRLMCDMRLDFSNLSQYLEIDFKQYFEKEIEAVSHFQEDELIEYSESGIQVTENGRLFIRNIAMCFDAYLESNQQQFSKTV